MNEPSITHREPSPSLSPYAAEDFDMPFDGAILKPAPGASPHALDNNPRYRILRSFHSRFLPDDRDVTVYLPEAYRNEPARRFPVFYLHDGQNLFDTRTSYVPGHTWRAHLTADRLTAAGLIEPVILVGIANTGASRIAEYTPTRDPRRGGGEGSNYGRLLVEELKPLIDRRFRTLPDPSNTALGGSSLGGLISLFVGLEYPQVFSKLAVLSPSVWWDRRSILRLVGHSKQRPSLRIWLDIGTAEGLRHVRDADLLHRRLVLRGWRDGQDIHYKQFKGAFHSEDAWAGRFDQVLQFLFPAQVSA